MALMWSFGQPPSPQLSTWFMDASKDNGILKWYCQNCQAELEDKKVEQIIHYCKEEWAQKLQAGYVFIFQKIYIYFWT